MKPWTEEKLDIFRKYLVAYAKIMNSQKKSWLSAFHYIDAFAGPGYYQDEDSHEFLEGSPLIALNIEPRFDKYWFVDLSREKTRNLEKIREDFPERNIEILRGDANRILREVIIPELTKRERARQERGIVILDPYGLQIDWTTVEEIAKARIFDVFINFSLMGIIRNLPSQEAPDGPQLELMERVLGSSDWVNELYTSQKGLFGDVKIQRGKISPEWIACFYRYKLRDLFRYVSNLSIMKNSKNSPIYALVLASHNSTAIKITNDILKNFYPVKC